MFVNKDGNYEITVDGYNYLNEKRNKQFNNQLSTKNNESFKSVDNKGNIALNNDYSTLVNFYETRFNEMKENYETQLKEQKQQVEYFKNLYEDEKSERIKAIAQYNTYLLDTAENNKKRWWNFWK